MRGEIEIAPARIHFAGEPDPREIRAKLGMTQEEFAAALCISVKTLRNWEQGRRDPSGPPCACCRSPRSIPRSCSKRFPPTWLPVTDAPAPLGRCPFPGVAAVRLPPSPTLVFHACLALQGLSNEIPAP